MVLDEGDGGLQRLHSLTLMLDHNLMIRLLNIYVLTNHGIGTQPERQSHDEPDTHLSHNLIFTFQAIFVAAEYLDVIIKESQESQPQRSDNHQDKIDITHTSQKNDRHKNSNNDDNASHGGYTFFLHTKRIN